MMHKLLINACCCARCSMVRRHFLLLIIGLFGIGLTTPVLAQQSGFPALSSIPGPDGGTTYTLSLQTLILLTSLTFLPAVVLMMSCFTRIIIVLSLLRQALGTQTSPPNQVLIGLALFLTLFIMSPVIDSVYTEAYLPFSEDKISIMEAADKAAVPLKTFMLHQTRETDIALFAQIAGGEQIESPELTPMKILVPAYITSELKTAFQIGFIVFIPFLIIDMVVASTLMAMGMMMLSPMIISLPFKLMLFVLADGWHLLIGSLTRSFYV